MKPFSRELTLSPNERSGGVLVRMVLVRRVHTTMVAEEVQAQVVTDNQAGRTRVLTTMVAEEVQVVTDRTRVLVHTATITMMVCCVYIC
jgi:hypothetical protein